LATEHSFNDYRDMSVRMVFDWEMTTI